MVDMRRRLTSMVYKVFDKKTGSGSKASVSEEQDQELHKLVIKKGNLYQV